MKRWSPKSLAWFFIFTIVLLCVLSFAGKAQQVFPIGNKTANNKALGVYKADSGLIAPVVKKIYTYWDSCGSICVIPGGNLFYHNRTGWQEVTPGGGTVTSVGSGYGLSGGPITTTGTLLVDTADIATRARVQKAIDSLNAVKGSGTVTSVAAGYGTTFSTITTTGSVIVDTAAIATRARVQKAIDSLNAVKGSGTVTSVATDGTLTGGTITTTGTLGINLSSANTWVAVQTFSSIPVFTNGIASATATTQTAGDNSTKVATTAYVDVTYSVQYTTAASYTTSVAIASTTASRMSTVEYIITAQAGALLFAAPTGSWTDGQQLIIRIKDDGTARALTWNSAFRASSDLALPSTTVLSKTLYLGFIYNSADSKYDFVSKLGNF